MISGTDITCFGGFLEINKIDHVGRKEFSLRWQTQPQPPAVNDTTYSEVLSSAV